MARASVDEAALRGLTRLPVHPEEHRAENAIIGGGAQHHDAQ